MWYRYNTVSNNVTWFHLHEIKPILNHINRNNSSFLLCLVRVFFFQYENNPREVLDWHQIAWCTCVCAVNFSLSLFNICHLFYIKNITWAPHKQTKNAFSWLPAIWQSNLSLATKDFNILHGIWKIPSGTSMCFSVSNDSATLGNRD